MNTNPPVRAALIGSGLFATNVYLPSLKVVPGLEITAIWSRSEASALQLGNKAKELGFPALQTRFGDAGLTSIIEGQGTDPIEVDAVILVLPITAQPALVRRAWKAGKHVLSEKPLGRDVEEGRILVAEYEDVWKPKGLIWRVAENWAHEPLLLKAGELLRNPAIGSVLYWRMHFETVVVDGEAWHGTTWRTIPSYQGGFILDGGVHWAAMLRTVLPDICQPAVITANKSLHRTHILPHDTIVGIISPAPAATREPHGPPTTVKAEIEATDMPVKPGKSTPHGTFVLSWAAPDTPQKGRPPNELYIATEHATVQIGNAGGKWTVTVTPAENSGIEPVTLNGQSTGVEAELDDFAHAVSAALAGTRDDRPNHASPHNALWDLAFIEAALNSDGTPTEIEYK